MNPIDRLAMHIGLTKLLLERGSVFSILQSELIVLRSAAKDVIDDEEIHGDTVITVPQLIPDAVIDGLLEDIKAPNDLGGLE